MHCIYPPLIAKLYVRKESTDYPVLSQASFHLQLVKIYSVNYHCTCKLLHYEHTDRATERKTNR